MKVPILAALCLVAAPALQAQSLLDGLGAPFDVPGQIALESGIEMLSSALAAALQTSRDAARAAGTQPIPPHIHEALFAYYPPELLAGIEYRVGVSEDATLQAYSIRYGDATAVTTIDTITFADPSDAISNLALWVHEVKHVEQFRAWGVLGFARRYVRDHQAVEREAYDAARAVQAGVGSGG